MKKYKAITAALLSIAICLAFTACKKANNTSKDSTTAIPTDTTTVATTKAPQSPSEEEFVEEVLDPEVESSINAEKAKHKSTTSKNGTASTTVDYTTTRLDVTASKGKPTLSADEVQGLLTDFYGTTYIVSKAEVKKGFQLYMVRDKKGKDYAIVRVDLVTGDTYESLVYSGEENYYNLFV